MLTVATADKLYKEAKSNNKKTRIVQISNGAECDKFVPESVTEDQSTDSGLKKICCMSDITGHWRLGLTMIF